MMIDELFLSGFCKAQNQTRTVLCEVEVSADGGRKIVSADCAYPDCAHSRECVVYREFTTEQSL